MNKPNKELEEFDVEVILKNWNKTYLKMKQEAYDKGRKDEWEAKKKILMVMLQKYKIALYTVIDKTYYGWKQEDIENAINEVEKQ